MLPTCPTSLTSPQSASPPPVSSPTPTTQIILSFAAPHPSGTKTTAHSLNKTIHTLSLSLSPLSPLSLSLLSLSLSSLSSLSLSPLSLSLCSAWTLDVSLGAAKATQKKEQSRAFFKKINRTIKKKKIIIIIKISSILNPTFSNCLLVW
ncbi:hypothetical protein L211DRAFT_482528 [Terfezia boudieri ATCC MYA-4762]|uniref:Uncharacterized protein n=1 Tax=Terfezia boudieri ATCC MYA-4762 TaxID=1051890 RepID=A0A3N4LYS8_9PEZI|nr:hypothetical protein L211DRAFT_482528 [Terfezia boudieri ATCC MYA-4762]